MKGSANLPSLSLIRRQRSSSLPPEVSFAASRRITLRQSALRATFPFERLCYIRGIETFRQPVILMPAIAPSNCSRRYFCFPYPFIRFFGTATLSLRARPPPRRPGPRRPAKSRRGAAPARRRRLPQRHDVRPLPGELKQQAVAAGVSQRALAEASPGLVYDQGIVNRDRGQRVFGQVFTEFAGRMAAPATGCSRARRTSRPIQPRSRAPKRNMACRRP